MTRPPFGEQSWQARAPKRGMLVLWEYAQAPASIVTCVPICFRRTSGKKPGVIEYPPTFISFVNQRLNCPKLVKFFPTSLKDALLGGRDVYHGEHRDGRTIGACGYAHRLEEHRSINLIFRYESLTGYSREKGFRTRHRPTFMPRVSVLTSKYFEICLSKRGERPGKTRPKGHNRGTCGTGAFASQISN